MPRITTAPTPAQFAAAWKEEVADKVRAHAGRDGRLSTTEARRMAERLDSGKLAADNAVNYLAALGQDSVSVEKFLGDAEAYVKAQGENVAGANGRISLVEARLLPPDLRQDFEVLRGTAATPTPPDEAQLRTRVLDLVTHFLDDGAGTRLSRAPASVRGRRPYIENVPHPATRTRAIVYVAGGNVYLSRAASEPSPLVGWYKVGKLPV